MRRFLWLLPATLMLLAGLACDEDPAEPTDAPPGIVGTVLDADSLPVVGAPVGLIYGLPGFLGWSDWPPAAWPQEEDCDQQGSLSYRFGLAAPSDVTLRIVDHRGHCVRLLIDSATLPAGEHGIIWPRTDNAGALVPNGAYRARIEIRRTGFEELLATELLLLNALSVDYADCLGPATITDDEGRFRIPYAAMPIGAEVDDSFGPHIVPDTLWIQSAVEGFGARRLLRIEDFQADLPVILRWTQRRD